MVDNSRSSSCWFAVSFVVGFSFCSSSSMPFFSAYENSLCVFYCSCCKSIDLINLENACEYFATKSLLLVGQVPPLVVISCFSVLLCLSSILQSYTK